MVERSEIQYAVAGEHHIAYRVLTGDGDGGHDVVMLSGGVFPMDSLPGDPLASRLLDGLAGLGRLVIFDRRGIGLSDQIVDWETSLHDQWVQDLSAVVESADLESPIVFSWLGDGVARRYTVHNTDKVGSLILWNPHVPIDDPDWDPTAVGEALEQGLQGPVMSEAFFPERWKDPVFRDWHDAAGRAGASPSLAARLLSVQTDLHVLDSERVRVPTLVIARTPPAMPFKLPDGYFARAANLIPGAALVDLGEGSYNPFGLGVEDVLAEITRFVTGEVKLPEPERSLAAVLFTDVVGSTRRATEVGDQHWKALLDHHDEISDSAIRRHGGELVKATGDGVLALFRSSTEAIRAARDIERDLARVDLTVRTGIHVGQVDRRGGDVSGLAVNVAARIMSVADGDQILVSDVVASITDDVMFVDVGERELKDLDGTWRLFEVG